MAATSVSHFSVVERVRTDEAVEIASASETLMSTSETVVMMPTSDAVAVCLLVVMSVIEEKSVPSVMAPDAPGSPRSVKLAAVELPVGNQLMKLLVVRDGRSSRSISARNNAATNVSSMLVVVAPPDIVGHL